MDIYFPKDICLDISSGQFPNIFIKDFIRFKYNKFFCRASDPKLFTSGFELNWKKDKFIKMKARDNQSLFRHPFLNESECKLLKTSFTLNLPCI